ncbi:diacylglycerol kinase family protein [Salinibacterium sp. SYSU T00001]|uniref:diacylglycerol/lipid kinase family protein n=1 Tax=Homoserinimonas sedimenticola TaxID=2986805 RepID=UPI0022354F5A|nr:diacylglycerol kinase family protein [Salinibacterium sedimenticola]MCW4384930.1 diacylglycerol kinase family protein [Salinibacterium sedimenticola]
MTTSRGKRIVVAINPNAAFGRGRDVAPLALAELSAAGHDVSALTAASFEELRAAAAAELEHGADALVVVGGDGMVSLGVNLVAGTQTPLGIVPSGTGNDAARNLGIPVGNTEAATRMLVATLEHQPRVIDTGRATLADGTSRWFVGVLSAGFDAVVNERANRLRWPRGPRRYTLAIVWELLRFRPVAYRVEIDGVPLERRAMLAAVANSTSFGGGMTITPEARLDDGELDLFLVAPLTKLQFLRLFPSVYTGGHVTHPSVSIVRARSVRLDADAAVAYADGERLGELPVTVEVVPGALRVLAPLL